MAVGVVGIELGSQGEAGNPAHTAGKPAFLELAGRQQLGKPLDRTDKLPRAFGPFPPVGKEL